MKCFLDMDGVLVDFVGGACKLHNMPYPYPALNGIWDFVEALNLNSAKFWAPMGREFWANLKPTPEMPTIIQLLENKFGKTNVCLLTSPCQTDGCIDGKMDWIKAYIPDYKRRVMFSTAKEFLAHPKTVLVDDAEHNTAPFNEHGGQGILLARPWNRRFYDKDKSLMLLQDDLNSIKIN